jgi:hypothetical protein
MILAFFSPSDVRRFIRALAHGLLCASFFGKQANRADVRAIIMSM